MSEDNLKLSLAQNRPLKAMICFFLIVGAGVLFRMTIGKDISEKQDSVKKHSDIKRMMTEAYVMIQEGRFREAAERLETVIREVPGTFEATEAQDLLEEIESRLESYGDYYDE